MASETSLRAIEACRAEIESLRNLVNDYLLSVIPDDPDVPESLGSAMRYSLNAGGKRLRPVLAMLAYKSFGKNPADIIAPACALELIHTYSLIHDDLPCMDDDDYRRGKPTLHKEFSEAIAVLAGDALHALAFELLSAADNQRVVHEVARAIGITGMLAGQVADVEAEGSDINRESIEYIHRRKTGALIAVAVKLGAMLAGANQQEQEVFSAYGSRIGLAFQIVDDILDITGSQEKLGKDIGSDERNKKATFPRAVGLDESRAIAHQLIDEAKAEISGIGREAETLVFLADYIIARDQ